MPIDGNMSHTIPRHVLRVGQTICQEETDNQSSSCNNDDAELDISLENLNQLILELDPTFEPILRDKSPPCISPYTDSSPDDDVSRFVLVPRGCSSSPSMVPSPSQSIPIPTGAACSPHGSVVFSGSPSRSRPPLPCGSVHRRNPPHWNEKTASQGSLRTSHSCRNSATSLLSMSPGSDTSYILGSCLSLASEDADSPESALIRTSGSCGSITRPFNAGSSAAKPTALEHFQELHSKGAHSSPASLAGSLTDIPVVLLNGAPEPELCRQWSVVSLPHQTSNSKPVSPQSFHISGSQPSMKFVMDTSKFWFRPHMNRAEAEALVKDREAGTFVVRDSTSFRGCFGLAMKVDQAVNNISASNYPGETNSEFVRHFLIESSAKGVCIKGSSHEPYFGSLSALVYQHTISAYALPCKLLLQSHDVYTGEDRTNDKTTSEANCKTACNFLYLNAVPTEMLTGPYAVQMAVSSTLQKDLAAMIPTTVNLKVSLKGVTLTDINRKLFFRRHYPAHLLSYSGEDPENRLWLNKSTFGARMFGIVAKGTEAGMENVCHVFAEYDPLQPCTKTIEFIQNAIAKP